MGTSVYTVPATNLSEPREFYNTNALLSNWHYMGYVYDKAIGVKTAPRRRRAAAWSLPPWTGMSI